MHENSKRVLFDPPGGWMYGFPKVLPQDHKQGSFDLKKWLLDNGYPEKDIELALKYSRYIYSAFDN